MSLADFYTQKALQGKAPTVPYTGSNQPGFGLGYLTTENIGGLLGNKTTQQVNYDIARRFPPALAEQYNNIAQEGIYGQQGMAEIQNKLRLARSMRMRALRNRYGGARRLGARSGAYDTSLLNTLYAPALAEESGQLADLTAQNLQSRSSVGLAGLNDLLAMAVGQYESAQNREAQKPDAFEKFTGLLNAVGSIVPG